MKACEYLCLVGLLLSIWGWAFSVTRGNVTSALGVSSMGMLISISFWLYFWRQDEPSCEENANTEIDDFYRSSEGTVNDPILEPKHKIFLSYSGEEKEFVEHLCKALEDWFHYPFFDRRPHSLPKGERFAELIVQAAEQCEMLIVVVSEEYFMSKWPMIELSAFVQAHNLDRKPKDSTKRPKILPLFYGLSIDDLKDATMQKKWIQKWKTLAKADQKKRIIVSDWNYAFDVLRSFNGLPYDKNLKEILAYEKKIVSWVCKTIPPDMRWNDSHVQGKSHILKVINKKIKGVGISNHYKVKVVGIYGVGGIGKTTACKTLCNELSRKYKQRICHIEFPIVPSSVSKDFFQKILGDLTKISMDVIQRFDDEQCKDILHDYLCKEKTFLAIDNILDNDQSMTLARMMLKLPYHPKSLVFVTTRSQHVLESLGLDLDACLEMPDLGEADAVKLFLHHVVGGKDFFGDQEKRDILTCVKTCYFSKGDGQGYHYHPLALQTLGLQLGNQGENPFNWVENLPHVETFNPPSEENHVFDILKSSFNLLPPRDQTLFIDLGRLSYLNDHSMDYIIERLCIIHGQDKENILQQLDNLKQKGLLVDVNLESGRISIHDLYREFAHSISRERISQ